MEQGSDVKAVSFASCHNVIVHSQLWVQNHAQALNRRRYLCAGPGDIDGSDLTSGFLATIELDNFRFWRVECQLTVRRVECQPTVRWVECQPTVRRVECQSTVRESSVNGACAALQCSDVWYSVWVRYASACHQHIGAVWPHEPESHLLAVRWTMWRGVDRMWSPVECQLYNWWWLNALYPLHECKPPMQIEGYPA